jgi:pimeloyl-ACP methyl ester carboxylesterase
MVTSGCFGVVVRVSGVIAAVIVFIVLAMFFNQNLALAQTRGYYPAPGKLVEVAGHRMHIDCTGSGSPTVVIDAGNGSFSVEWTPIQAALAQSTRVCTYDRSGYGWSEPGPQPRDGMQIVSELHELLSAAGEHAPYLLVGHSLGGVHMRMYAVKYPAEVAGMILVDTAYPLSVSAEFQKQMQASIGFYRAMELLTGSGLLRALAPLGGKESMPATARKMPPDLQNTYLNLLLDPAQYSTAIAEMEQLPQTFAEASRMLAAEKPLGDLPLIVITAGQTDTAGSTPFNEKYIPVPYGQFEAQAELAGQSSRGQQHVIHESGHSVHLDAPDEVIKAGQEMIQSCRK